MIGTPISRWTMSYFASALAWLFVALFLMIVGIGYPASGISSPDTLILVHAVCIGWLSLALSGALFQFVPVLVGRPLFSERIPLPALAILNAGLVGLLVGFHSLDDPSFGLFWLPSAAGLLIVGFSLVIIDLGTTAWQRPTGPSAFVLGGISALFATICYGAMFALALVGRGGRVGELAIAHGIPLHAIAGLGGWLTLTAMGVSYRLLPMFMLSPDIQGRQSYFTLIAGAAAVAAAVIGGSIAIAVALETISIILASSFALGIVAVIFYGRDVFVIFRTRKKRHLELNIRMSVLSFGGLIGVILLGVIMTVTGTIIDHAGAFAFLTAFGWLSGLVLAKLYKIVAFLTWIETYGPVLGRASTPRVQDLVVERRAEKWFLVYYASVWIGTASLMIEHRTLFQGCAAFVALGAAGIAYEMIRIRRLADVGPELRPSGGALMPPLLFARIQGVKT